LVGSNAEFIGDALENGGHKARNLLVL